MDATEKPRTLPKQRARTDTIRITPVRRTTITPDAWGFRSVPGMLSDFQRHTSHRVPSQRVLAASDGSASLSDHISTALSFGALPAMLTAIYFAHIAAQSKQGSVGADLFSVGAVFVPAALFTHHKLPQALAGSVCLVLAAILCGPALTPLVAALSVLSRPRLRDAKYWEWAWYAATFVLVAYLAGQVLAPLPLIGLIWSQLYSAPSPQRKRSRNEILLAALLVISCGCAGLVFSEQSYLPLLAGLIAAGSSAVYFLAGETIAASRYDPIVCCMMSAAVGALLRSSLDPKVLLEIAILLPSALGPRSVDVTMATAATSASSSSVLDSILAHDDTRGIFYFFLLNFGFMLVQLLYSMLSHSLGLLSDSIHMFFDCLALLVGLVASILAKFPPSSRFPYGLAMVETVSGFANGCLLLAISVGVLFEAFERITNPVQLEKMTELIVVSILGLLVNLVGIFAFNHGHAHGHSHSHSHSHSHGHNHDHDTVLPLSDEKASHVHSNGSAVHTHTHTDSSSSHAHSHSHSPSPTSTPSRPAAHSHAHSHSHHAQPDSHSHGSDNLEGIFLHIVADTLGSVGVIISTVLTYIFGWSGFDAIASIIISVLIFLSAIPLVTSSARSLLLSLSDKDEYALRNVLNDIYLAPGVVSYTVPKFWNDGRGIRGMIHVQYAATATGNAVRERVRAALMKGGIENFVIQMEEEGAPCWCHEDSSVKS